LHSELLELIPKISTLGLLAKIQMLTQFQKAVEKGRHARVIELVRKGADFRANDDAALKLAAKKGHLDLVKYFVGLGCDPCSENSSALKYSASRGHLPIVMYLAEHGCDLRHDNDYALAFSVIKNYVNIATFLVSFVEYDYDFSRINARLSKHGIWCDLNENPVMFCSSYAKKNFLSLHSKLYLPLWCKSKKISVQN
jgi:ankyrin repeat protein